MKKLISISILVLIFITIIIIGVMSVATLNKPEPEPAIVKEEKIDDKYISDFDQYGNLSEPEPKSGPSPPMGLKIVPDPFVYYLVRFKGSSRRVYCESYAYEEGGIVLNVIHKDTNIKKGKPLPMKMLINKDSMYSIALKEAKTKEEALKKRG